ncbi:MAG: aminopeptidase [Flavobacterium sp.]|nr:aminopeptidase [Flavobacterium sp.]
MTLKANLDSRNNILTVEQDLTYFNQTNDTIATLVLNDWINAYSDKNSNIGKRFSDEFVRSFHFAPAKDLGGTNNLVIVDDQNSALTWHRPLDQVDLVEISLTEKILPFEKKTIHLKYQVKIPDDRFTKYGYDSATKSINLKDWHLVPARYDNHQFVRHSNADTDDIANGVCDYELQMTLPNDFQLSSDLNENAVVKSDDSITYTISGKQRQNFSLYISPTSKFYSYKNDEVEVVTNLKDNNLTDIQKALMIDRVVNYVQTHVGKYPFERITVSEVDYDRNPFYGLNQLPSFINVFQDEFVFELKFLKTYLNNYLKNTLRLDPRKDNWIYDGMQVYLMMKYMEENRPEMKMLGGLSRLKVLKSFNIIGLDFNEQYSYYYLFMARKNLDQPLSSAKDSLIRFNEKIASKYRAGLSLNYLDHYLENNAVEKTLQDFYVLNGKQLTNAEDFQKSLQQQTPKDLSWFFTSVIGTRDLIDYTFKHVSKTKDSITFTIKNRTGTTVPIPVYGLKNKQVVFKQWFENISKDSTFTVSRQEADKIVLNYNSEVPEFNRRNNWKSLQSFLGNNRPFKFVLFKDIEDPNSNQIIYVPSITYNLYDGLSPGIRFGNRTLLNKPFLYDVNPVYSPNTGSLRGLASVSYNQFLRDSRLFFVRYGISSSYFNYAQDAAFLRVNPNISLNFRDSDMRKNDRQSLIFRYNAVQKQESKIVLDNTLENYAIFNVKYITSKQELVHYFNFITDTQFSSSFGRVSTEINYRRLFNNNRQFNFRLFAGSFLYDRSSSNTFYFGVSKINDYLFEQELLGRSEKSGIFSQQFIMGDGGFKSKVLPEAVNKWLVATNLSFNVWNWIEVYGDLGLVKNSSVAEKFVYDNGIRFNLVPDYFEFYFPVYSNNGWEIAQDRYGEKIRIVFTIDPKVLVNLFTRKWF